MKETEIFKPSKEVIDVLRKVEKETEKMFNEIRKEMGSLAYSKLMGLKSKKEVDDFFKSLTASNFTDYTSSIVDIYCKIENKRVKMAFLTKLQEKLSELNNELNRNEEYASFKKHAEALILIGKEQFALEEADKDIKNKKSFFLYRAKDNGCVVRANIEVLKESLDSLNIRNKKVETFYIQDSILGSGIHLSALETFRLMSYLEKKGWDLVQYRPILFYELQFNFNTEFKLPKSLNSEKEIQEFFSTCSENAKILTPGTFIRYFPILKGKLLRVYEKQLKLFFAYTPDINEICNEWFVCTDFSIEKELESLKISVDR